MLLRGRAALLHKHDFVRVASLVSSFCERLPGKQFFADAASLLKPGAPSRGYFKSSGRGVGTGSLAMLRRSRHYVVVKDPVLELDLAALAASIDLEPAISATNKPPLTQHCWHAARIHHRLRCFNSAESCCERWGSLMHGLWDDSQNLEPSRLVDRLFLKEAQVECTGGDRDEWLISELVTVLQEMKKDPIVKRRRRTVARHLAGDPSLAIKKLRSKGSTGLDDLQVMCGDSSGDEQLPSLHAELRSFRGQSLAEKRLQHRRLHQPRELDVDTRNSLVGCSTDGVVHSLPLYVQDARTARKSLANSSIRDHLQCWLRSSDGRSWQQAREQMWASLAGSVADLA